MKGRAIGQFINLRSRVAGLSLFAIPPPASRQIAANSSCDRPATVGDLPNHQAGEGVAQVSATPALRLEDQACAQLGHSGDVARFDPSRATGPVTATRLQGRRGAAPTAVDDRRAEWQPWRDGAKG